MKRDYPMNTITPSFFKQPLFSLRRAALGLLSALSLTLLATPRWPRVTLSCPARA